MADAIPMTPLAKNKRFNVDYTMKTSIKRQKLEPTDAKILETKNIYRPRYKRELKRTANLIPVTPMAEAKRFMVDCFEAVGTTRQNAETVADNLLEADYRGHYSHGMNRLGAYIRLIKAGDCNPNAQPIVEKETIATALVNGQNGLGSVIGKFCMDLAIEKASKAGIGMVTAHGSNHYGIAGIYGLQAVEKGFLGLSFTNTTPLVVPTRAKECALGTNPLALAAPGLNGDDFVLDMATSTVALGKTEMCRRKNETIPELWVLDNKDTSSIKLMPLGGNEINSGFKGYGLSMLVEILCGILSGSNYGPNVPRWRVDGGVANLGCAFIAIDPKAFAPGFEDRMTDLMKHLRGMEPMDPDKPVQVAGDPEKAHMKRVKEDGGLKYVKDQHNCNKQLAAELSVKPMESILKEDDSR